MTDHDTELAREIMKKITLAPREIGVITLLIICWMVDNYNYDNDLEKDATYERMASV